MENLLSDISHLPSMASQSLIMIIWLQSPTKIQLNTKLDNFFSID